jgi:hypothetical protein
VNPPEGEGSVPFTVEPRGGLATGTEIRNRARIVFDVNAPIDTPEWLNTIDDSLPASQVLALAATQASAGFSVRWSGSDHGSGVLDYTIFVSENGGSFVTWLTNTDATSASFAGQSGKTYAFYSVARDRAGNLEEEPPAPDAVTRIVSCIGDCGQDGAVTVNEILVMVNVALGNAPVSGCQVGDHNGDGAITIDEILTAVNNALNGCQS